MALTEESGGMVLPVAPMGSTGNGGFGGDFGGWLVLFLIFGLFNGGWGNGYGGGFGNAQLSYDFPWLLNGQNGINANTNAGFQNAAIQGSLGDIQTGLCSGFAGVTAAVNGAQSAIAQQLYANQIADIQSMNGVQSQLANCCCEQRLGLANLGADIAREACATRTTDTQNTQAILNQVNNGIQSIKDTLCADKIEQKNDVIAQLRSELMYARGQASQDVQTAAIQAGQRALANEVEQYVAPSPRPAYIVQNPNCCAQNYACGCMG